MCRACQELHIALNINENAPVIRRLLSVESSKTFESPLKMTKFSFLKNQEKSLKFPNWRNKLPNGSYLRRCRHNLWYRPGRWDSGAEHQRRSRQSSTFYEAGGTVTDVCPKRKSWREAGFSVNGVFIFTTPSPFHLLAYLWPESAIFTRTINRRKWISNGKWTIHTAVDLTLKWNHGKLNFLKLKKNWLKFASRFTDFFGGFAVFIF